MKHDTVNEKGEQPSPGKRSGKLVLYGFAGIGVILTIGFVAGLFADVAAFDPTSGGNEPPYDDYSGEPIDWDNNTYTTPTGMVKTGYVVDTHLNCTSGSIWFEGLNTVTWEFRELSDRAIAIHDPRGACKDRGFNPGF